MKKRNKYLYSIILCFLFIAGLTITSGAEDRKAITKVILTVTSDVDSGSDLGTVDVGVSDTAHYTVGGAEFVSSNDSWDPGDTPKVKITIYAENGYYFSGFTSSSKFSLKGCTYSSVKRLDDNETIELTVKLKPIKATLGNVPSADWYDSRLGRANWESVEHASSYELRLYRGDTVIQRIDKVSGTSFDFYPYMTKKGTYHYFVRAVPKNSSEEEYLTKGEWTESGEWTIDENEVAPENLPTGGGTPGQGPSDYQAVWVSDKNGWWYRKSDGTYPKSDWMLIDNKWYLFDSYGYMLTGWQNKNTKDYYLTNNGDMKTGWLQDNRQWYYLGADGATTKGWIQDNNKWYCMDNKGVMLTGWVTTADNKWYYLEPKDGAMVTNATVGGYYVDANGVWVH